MARARKGNALVIVESPAKARTIEKFLGAGFSVSASMGHVRDLPRKELGIDLEHDFAPTYRPIKDRQETLKTLKALARKADLVYLASDPDREGEAIAWHLAEALNLSGDKARRVVFNEITKPAILKAFEHPRAVDRSLVDSQQARRALDRIVGYRISPLLSQKVARGLSAGRVQSVAVRLVVDREAEIAAFKPEEYWTVTGTFKPRKGDAFEAGLVDIAGKALRRGAEPADRTLDRAAAEAVARDLLKASFACASKEAKEKIESPPPPFTTSTLQQQAAIHLRFSTKRTMQVAQQLYQGVDVGEGPVGLITYMRTDAVRMAEEAVAEARQVIGQSFGKAYLPEKPRRFKGSARAQEAHEAVRPTAFARHPDAVAGRLSPEQARLYRLIWSRALASQMAPARIQNTRLLIEADGHRFQADGKQIAFDGYLRVLSLRAPEEVVLPAVAQGEKLACAGLRPEQHATQPPPRYSEAGLVKMMEKLGIGRPSTYAPTLATIQTRGYVRLEQRRFHPTELGQLVTKELVRHFPNILDAQFTSRMEERLDEIESGRDSYLGVLKDFYADFEPTLEKARAGMADQKTEAEPTDEKCPKCGRPLVIKWSRHGKFFGCTGFAEQDPAKQCKYRRSFAPEAARPTGLSCDRCGSPMIHAQGRFGPYLACEKYADKACDFTMKLNKQGQPVRKFQPIPTDRACEKCGAPLVIRVSARGKRGPRPFLSCSAFPKCRAAADLPPELSPLGEQALGRWQANAIKNKADLAAFLSAQAESPGAEGSPEEEPE